MLLSGVRGCSAAHQVGRVAPRPRNRGHDWTLLAGKPLPKKRVMLILSSLTGQWLTGDLAVAERHALPDLAGDDEMRILATEM
jgi:hypothetical protein